MPISLTAKKTMPKQSHRNLKKTINTHYVYCKLLGNCTTQLKLRQLQSREMIKRWGIKKANAAYVNFLLPNHYYFYDSLLRTDYYYKTLHELLA